MKRAAIVYALLILVVGGLVAAVMTRETETEKAEAEAKAEEAEKKPTALPAEMTPGTEIAERVEAIRGLQFEGEPPPVQVVPEAELEKQLAALDQEPPQNEELSTAAALLLAQAGALPPEQAETLVKRRYGGTGVLGAYVPEPRTVLLAEELVEEDPETAELVAAHELSRALDVGPSPDAERVAPMFDEDRQVTVALRSGAAARAELEYGSEHLSRPPDKSEVELAREGATDPASPALVQTLATHPQRAGRDFVAAVHERGGWEAVDEALGEPPATMAEVLHPSAPAREVVEAPTFEIRPVLKEGWQRLAGADVGELDTLGLLRGGPGEEEQLEAIARGWRSGRFETWTKGESACPPPCRDKSASVVVWRFADDAASLAFVRAMREALVESTAAEPEGGRGFTIEGAGAALVRSGRFAALTFAPDAPTAGTLAETALEP